MDGSDSENERPSPPQHLYAQHSLEKQQTPDDDSDSDDTAELMRMVREANRSLPPDNESAPQDKVPPNIETVIRNHEQATDVDSDDESRCEVVNEANAVESIAKPPHEATNSSGGYGKNSVTRFQLPDQSDCSTSESESEEEPEMGGCAATTPNEFASSSSTPLDPTQPSESRGKPSKTMIESIGGTTGLHVNGEQELTATQSVKYENSNEIIDLSGDNPNALSAIGHHREF